MNVKKNFLGKKNVVNILSLILTGTKTNKDLAKALGKKQSTISEHLSVLKQNKIISLGDNKKNNLKEYIVDCEKIAELFLRYFIKKRNLIQFKDSVPITLSFAGIIAIKKGLIKNAKKFSSITLADIFSETLKWFYYCGILLRNSESSALKSYEVNNDEKVKFVNFLRLFDEYVKKIMDEDKKDRVIKEFNKLMKKRE